jgi:hypothetical protein
MGDPLITYPPGVRPFQRSERFSIKAHLEHKEAR